MQISNNEILYVKGGFAEKNVKGWGSSPIYEKMLVFVTYKESWID